MRLNLLSLVLVVFPATSVFGLNALVRGNCTCEPSITGETGDGGNATQAPGDVSPHHLTGTITVVNEGELDGRCLNGEDCVSPKECRIDFRINVSISTGTTTPDHFRFGGNTYILAASSPYTGTTGSMSTDDTFTCGTTKEVVVKVRDSSNNVLSENTFVANCQNCAGA